MHIHARTLTVKASDRYISRVSIGRIPVKENRNFKVSASQYSASVLTVQKQYDWEHRPIINGGESGPIFYKGRWHSMYKSICESGKRLMH